MGAKVILITGKTDLEKPKNVKVISASDADDFYKKTVSNLPCDVFISGYLQFRIGNQKNYREDKKNGKEISITFKQNIDILEKISKHKKRPRLVIGFQPKPQN